MVNDDERVQRYAEALGLRPNSIGAQRVVRTLLPVIDAEQAELRAEVGRQRSSILRHIEDGLDASGALIAALDRADVAEAEAGRLGLLLATAESDRDGFDSERLDWKFRAEAAERALADERAQSAELTAKVARIEALRDRWLEDGENDNLRLEDVATDLTAALEGRRRVAPKTPCPECHCLYGTHQKACRRAALAGPEPGPCRQCHARHAIETGEDGYACCLACSESSGGTHFEKPGTSDG